MGDRLRLPPFRVPPAPVLGLLFLALAFALYGPALRSPFLFDDETTILSNARVADPRNFLPPSGPRDVAFLTFALNHLASSVDPLPYHAVNVGIHAVNALLVLLLLGRVADHLDPAGRGGRNRALAAAAALLFLVHPLQTGAVSYVSQRFTSLCALFYLLSFLTWLAASDRFRREGRFLSPGHLAPYLASVASALLAMKTKEIAMTLPLAVLAWELLFRRKGAGPGERPVPLPYALPLLLTVLVVPAHYLSVPSSVGDLLREVGVASAETRKIGRWEYLLTQTRVLVTYGRLFFLPVGQSLDHDYALSRSLLEPAVLACLALHGALAAAAVRVYRRTASGTLLLVPFGILWSYLALSVESTLVPIRDVIFEHRAYLPFPGMAAAACAGAVAAAERLPEGWGRKALAALLAVSLLLLSALTVRRNLLWSDGFAIWRDAAEKAPGKARPRVNLGLLYFDRGMLAEAKREYLEGLRVEPYLPVLHNNLGNVLRQEGNRAGAMEEYRRALLLDPADAAAHCNLGVTLAESGALDEARVHLLRAVAIAPETAEAYVTLANIEDVRGNKEKALRLYAVALELSPGDAVAWYNRGVVRESLGDGEGARADYRRALSLSPGLEHARKRLGALGG